MRRTGRRGRPAAAPSAVALGVALLGVWVPARAADQAQAALAGAELLPDDAAAYVALRPLDLPDGFALVDLLSGVFPDAARRLTSIRDGLGFFELSRPELTDNGIDPEAPMLAAWGSLDPAEWSRRVAAEDAAAAAAARKKGKPGKTPPLPPVWARHRLVIKLSDAGKFRGYVAAILAAHDAEVASPVRAKGDPPAPGWFAVVRGAAQADQLALVARGRDGGLVTLRRLGDFAVLDWAEPWAPGAPDPKRDYPALLSKLVAAPAHTLAAALSGPGRTLLADDASIGLLAQAGPTAALLPTASCRQDWSVSSGALVDAATVSASLHPFKWRLQIGWQLTGAGRARLEGAGADDGLLDPRAAVSDAVATGGLLLGALETLRAAPRVGPFAGGLTRALDEIDSCGPLALAVTAVRFWPQLLGAGLDARVVDRASKQLLATTRNLVAVVRGVPVDVADLGKQLTVIASFPDEVGTELLSFLELGSSGSPERSSFGERTPTFYDLTHGSGFGEAGLERIAGGRYGLALTARDNGLGWYYGRKRPPSRRGPLTNVGYLHVNVGRLLSLWAESADAATQKAVRLASSQLGILGGNLDLDGGVLRLDLGLGAP